MIVLVYIPLLTTLFLACEARVSKQVVEQMAHDLLRDDDGSASTPDAGGGGAGGSTIVEMTPNEARYKSVVRRLFENCNEVLETANGLKWKWICKLDKHVVSFSSDSVVLPSFPACVVRRIVVDPRRST